VYPSKKKGPDGGVSLPRHPGKSREGRTLLARARTQRTAVSENARALRIPGRSGRWRFWSNATARAVRCLGKAIPRAAWPIRLLDVSHHPLTSPCLTCRLRRFVGRARRIRHRSGWGWLVACRPTIPYSSSVPDLLRCVIRCFCLVKSNYYDFVTVLQCTNRIWPAPNSLATPVGNCPQTQRVAGRFGSAGEVVRWDRAAAAQNAIAAIVDSTRSAQSTAS
jgi:hypothetical protein